MLHLSAHRKRSFARILVFALILYPFLGARSRAIVRVSAQDRAHTDAFSSTVFFGDSTTAHLRSRGVLPGGKDTTQVWCPKCGTLMLDAETLNAPIYFPKTNEALPLREALKKKKPAYFVVTLGINGVHVFDEKKYKACYRKLIRGIREASPETVVILQSVFPVSNKQRAWTSLSAKELNERIDRMNVWVCDLAKEFNVQFLNTATVLKNGENELRAEFDVGDGIHLNADGYRAVLAYLRANGYDQERKIPK